MSMIETTQLQKNDIGIDKEYVRKVRHEVARRLALKNISTSEESLRKQAAIEEAIAILEERASDFILNGRRMPTIEEDQQIIEQVVAGMFGVGNLQSYLDDDQIENIDINGPEEVWITFANGVKVRGLPVAKFRQMNYLQRRFEQYLPSSRAIVLCQVERFLHMEYRHSLCD